MEVSTSCSLLLWYSVKGRSVTDETRTFYSQCGSTLEDILTLHLRQTYGSSLKYVADSNNNLPRRTVFIIIIIVIVIIITQYLYSTQVHE